MFSLNEQEEITNDFLDVIEVNDKATEINKKNKCQSSKFDSINIAFKHSILLENIVGQIPQFDDNTVHEKYGELGMFLLFFTHTQTKNDPKNLGSLWG